ncbi:class I SAM-dependent methyltransferase [Fodinibius sp. Rm-B-1B1-1]|uniref:class I SAM-dependent methyltransferase n=1 Tax=Fodinibius alkaliphilus TaxID=3140241 RepID=UPI00315AFF33
MEKLTCLNCGNRLEHTFADLGTSPLCNEILTPEQVNDGQMSYPLHTYVCDECFLVQVGKCVSPEKIYKDYSYFSSYSNFWLRHAEQYVDFMIENYDIDRESFVVEIASNDGYLLQYFNQKNIPLLGIEPSHTVAKAALNKGIPTEMKFFGTNTAKELKNKYQPADLILGNNVLAHVPSINDFIEGLGIMLSEKGIMTFEFPHLMQLVENNQFDTIYHEHFFYYSLHSVQALFKKHGFKVFDVQELDTHGGSIRIFVSREANREYQVSRNVEHMLTEEKQKGYLNVELYKSFEKYVRQTKRDILRLLLNLKNQGKSIVGYGAPGKGNTLLNYCGIGTDFIDYTVDRSPHKQGHYLPGSLIPILSPDKIKDTEPDYIFILPWNLKDEIIQQLRYVSDWGAQFIVPIPQPMVINSKPMEIELPVLTSGL